MRLTPLALSFALLAAAVPALACATPAASARSGPWSVELVGEDGSTLPTFQHRGRTYVLGLLGERYRVRVRNAGARRAEVVVSVDGRDVLDGRPASPDRRGYLVEPWGEVTVDGYRLDLGTVAAFRFSSVPRSYAARRGDARDVGVVGVAVFPERQLAAVAPPPWRDREASPRGAAGDAPAESRAEAPTQAGRSADAAPAPSAKSAPGVADGLARRRERPGLGTEFAERHPSSVVEVPFERASREPAAVLTLRYDDREGLAAAGVDLGDRWARDDRWLRETAEPFRGAGFAEPPAGWRGR